MDKAFWQQRYDENTTGWDIGQVSEPLKAYIDQLENKELRILIPGCGFGHEAKYLAESGFTNVSVIDLVDDAIRDLRENYPAIRCITGDFFALNENQSFDLILEQTLFCAIDPSLRDQYIQKVAELLVPDGKYVGVLFNREFEGGPPFGGDTDEYWNYFDPRFTHFRISECYNSIPQRAGTEVFVKAIR